ncbi:MAG: DJ-1/PfpI family protein [bacterium]
MSLNVKRILFILMPNDFQDTEFLEPYEMLLTEGHHVDVAGLTSRNIATGKFGYQHTPNKILAEMGPQDFDKYDALVIPGGQGCTEYLWDNEDVIDVVNYFHDNEKIVAAICHACVVLAQTGILRNKRATVYPSNEALEIFEDNDVIFVDEECVTLPDEKVITSQGPQYARIFGKAILELLQH